MSDVIASPNNKNWNCSQLKKLSSFDPFLDSSQMIRVGGRLGRSDLSFERIHLKLIPQGTVGGCLYRLCALSSGKASRKDNINGHPNEGGVLSSK